MPSSPARRSPPAKDTSRTRPRIPEIPLLSILLAGVIGIAAALVAISMLPVVGGLAVGARNVTESLGAAGDAFRRIPRFPERSTIYANDGTTVLATLYFDENRAIVRLREVSRVARKSVLAIEDDGFYEHRGLHVPSVVRALLANLVAGRIVQGGSTITQQLVKNALIDDRSQTVARKFQEAALALRLEQEYTKDRILELYLNEVYLGHGIYGIGTAAEYYFDRPASELTLPQAALLAGMIASPETYDPVDRPRAARLRRNDVLDRLAALGWVPEGRVARARRAPIRLRSGAGEANTVVRPFFVDLITRQILRNEGGEFEAFGSTFRQRRRTLFQGGLEIHTTLDPNWQRYAQAAADARGWSPAGPEVALASVDVRTGAIRALLSGRRYREDRKDLVWQGRRQPGSAFKPFTLVAAFRQGVPPGKVYESRSPYRDPRWNNDCHCVVNAEGAGDRGWMDLWAATQNSVNVVFAQLVLDVGAAAVVDAARDLGITTPLDPVPAITLGAEEVSPLEMASAFATLANGGKRCAPFAVVRVESRGKPLYEHEPRCTRAIAADIAHLVTAMLQRAVQSGTGTAAAIGRPVAGKTGTAQDYTNAWFAGYTPQVSTAVWVGFRQGQIPMDDFFGGPAFGGTVAAPIWHDFMVRAVAGMPVQRFPAPPRPERGRVPDLTGLTGRQAESRLADAGFTALLERVDSGEPKGTVLAQEPAPGTGAVLGGLVRVRVSTGVPPAVPVPDVVGLARWKAVATLEELGFVVATKEEAVSDPERERVVISQEPDAGASLESGSTVTITVGGAPRRPAERAR